MRGEKLTNAEKWKISFNTSLITTSILLPFFLIFSILAQRGNILGGVFLSLILVAPLFFTVLIGKRILFLNNLPANILYLIATPVLATSVWIFIAIAGAHEYGGSEIGVAMMSPILLFNFVILYSIFIIHKRTLLKPGFAPKFFSFFGMFSGVALILIIISFAILHLDWTGTRDILTYTAIFTVVGIVILFILHRVFLGRGKNNEK